MKKLEEEIGDNLLTNLKKEEDDGRERTDSKKGRNEHRGQSELLGSHLVVSFC